MHICLNDIKVDENMYTVPQQPGVLEVQGTPRAPNQTNGL